MTPPLNPATTFPAGEINKVRRIYRAAVADLGPDLDGGSLLDLLADNMARELPYLAALAIAAGLGDKLSETALSLASAVDEPALRDAYDAFITRCRQDGVSLASFECPACGESIETPRPEHGHVYDSITTCPHCEHLFFKVVRSNGTVTTTNPEEHP